MLEWIFRRCDGTAEGEETPVGIIPTADGINLDGLDIAAEAFEEVRTVDLDALRDELPQVREHLESFGDACRRSCGPSSRRSSSASAPPPPRGAAQNARNFGPSVTGGPCPNRTTDGSPRSASLRADSRFVAGSGVKES